MSFPSKDALDLLPVIGVGATGQVRRAGAHVIKVAHADAQARARLREEVQLTRLLLREGIPAAPILAARSDALLRRHLPGPPLSQSTAPRGARLRALFALWLQVRAFQQRHALRLDFTPANLYWVHGGPVFADPARRPLPPVFRSDTLEGFAQEWAAYLRSPPRRTGRVEPFWLPPSGRFHVEVPVGPDPRGQVLWRNERLLARLGLRWKDAALLALGNWSTQAKPTETRLATRYVDMIRFDERSGPKGDGRCVYLGEVQGQELTLKGCGPTPLAWKGRQFHEDGRVSLPRALWEVTVADELSRLGFESPEYLALLSSSGTTFDNTRRRWPAASGIRCASTHFRLGHLRKWIRRPGAFAAMLAHAGQRVVRPDFDPARPAHLHQLVDRFSSTLGHNTGRTDALQIHGFNPTPGNIRLDGHFIDFSTVRFHRHYLPDFRFLEDRYVARIHKQVWQRMVRLLVEVLAEGGALAKAELDLWLAPAVRRFQRGYQDGFFAGLAQCYGFAEDAGTAQSRARLVETTAALRALRGEDEVVLTFWKQRLPGPRFDVLGRAPFVVRALRAGHPEPWRALLVNRDVDGALPPEAVACAERWVACLRPFLARAPRPARSWSQVIRPQMEAEALAGLLYGRTRPQRMTEWKRFISTSRHLPEGRYGYLEARERARALGHVGLPTLGGGYEWVVGLTPELLHGIREAARVVLGRRLVGIIAHGSRVMERGYLRGVAPGAFTRGDLRLREREGVREGGPVAGESSDLDLKVFVRGPTSEREERRLGEALAALGAWFPLPARQPPRQRILSTAAREVVSAFRRWNGGPRKRELGKDAIPEPQVVVLDDGREGPALDSPQRMAEALQAPEVGGRYRRVALSRISGGEARPSHSLVMCLRDFTEAQPRVVVRPRGRGYSVVEGAEGLGAARAAGRRSLVVEVREMTAPCARR